MFFGWHKKHQEEGRMDGERPGRAGDLQRGLWGCSASVGLPGAELPQCLCTAAVVTGPFLHKILKYKFISHSNHQLQDPDVPYGKATVH